MIFHVSLIIAIILMVICIDLLTLFGPVNLSMINTHDVSTLMGFVKPASDHMYGIIMLLSEMTLLLSFVLLGILVVLTYICDVYNAENNPAPRHFEKTIESTLDVLFVFIPTILVLYLLIPSLGFIFNNEIELETVFNLDIVGNQWYWNYEYTLPLRFKIYQLHLFGISDAVHKIDIDSVVDLLSKQNRLLTVDNRLVLPSHTPINLRITAQDVIHSWSVPQLGIKVDAIPGRIMNVVLFSNFTGIYYGQCSELCGVNHAFMPIVVQVVDLSTFMDWCFISLKMNPSGELLKHLNLSNLVPTLNSFNEEASISKDAMIDTTSMCTSIGEVLWWMNMGLGAIAVIVEYFYPYETAPVTPPVTPTDTNVSVVPPVDAAVVPPVDAAVVPPADAGADVPDAGTDVPDEDADATPPYYFQSLETSPHDQEDQEEEEKDKLAQLTGEKEKGSESPPNWGRLFLMFGCFLFTYYYLKK